MLTNLSKVFRMQADDTLEGYALSTVSLFITTINIEIRFQFQIGLSAFSHQLKTSADC
jgi:hypothetical protein